jgi:pentapeptide repeat protein
MGEWQESVVFGLAAGVLVAFAAFVFRSAARKWTRGARLGMLIVAAIAVGAAAPAMLFPVEKRLAGPSDDVLARLAIALRSPDLDERMTALAELNRLAQNRPSTTPAIVELLSGFVRDRTMKAGDSRCADSEPARDVDDALGVLRLRWAPDDGVVVDLHGTCLAHADLRTLPARGGTFAGANLTGANLKSADLARADLHDANLSGASLVKTSLAGTKFFGARFADTDLARARFTDDTLWPPQHEDAVMAASSFDTTDFVIGTLVLSDPG